HRQMETCKTQSVENEQNQNPHLIKQKQCNGRKNTMLQVHLTSSANVNTSVEQARHWYNFTDGNVYQLVVGVNLNFSNKVEQGIATWYTASLEQTRTVIEIKQVFSFPDSQKGIVQTIGTWIPSLGLVNSCPKCPIDFGPQNFEGNILTITSFDYAPYILKGKNCSSIKSIAGKSELPEIDPTCYTDIPVKMVIEGDAVYVGYLVELVDALANKLNFRYKIRYPKNIKEHKFGVGKDDNYTGLVGILKRKEAEIALASLTVTMDRAEIIDFSYPIDYYYKKLYLRMDAIMNKFETGTYTKSFSLTIWLVLVVQLGIFVVGQWIICSKLRQETPDMRKPDDITFILFACLCQQGAPNTPVSYSGRTVFMLWWVFSVIVYAHYTAMLTSRLTLNTEGPPFTTLKGAVENKEWEIGIMDGTPMLQMLQELHSR
ncbi:unnamed protein product, partial [Meganyctiphanes norvegica]